MTLEAGRFCFQIWYGTMMLVIVTIFTIISFTFSLLWSDPKRNTGLATPGALTHCLKYLVTEIEKWPSRAKRGQEGPSGAKRGQAGPSGAKWGYFFACRRIFMRWKYPVLRVRHSDKNMPACKKIASFGPAWPRLAPLGHAWPPLAPLGPAWPLLAPLGPARPLFNFSNKIL